MPTTVEVMVQAFRAMGTPFLVGHPGGESVELMEAARRAGTRFVFAKQESAGAMIASTWGDITGAPGVCLSTRAPGAANMVNGVARAYLDRSPLIAITDQHPSHVYDTALYQRLDQQALYAPITKWGTTIAARTVRQQLARAVRTATAPPPGPVHFDLPATETTREAGGGPEVGSPEKARLRPDKESLAPALALLADARRPIVLAGMGVLWDRAEHELVSLVEQLGAPLLTTTRAKGALPEDHPLRAGVMIGGLLEREIVERADLIVAVGLDTVELQPKPWPYRAPVLALASTPGVDAIVPAAVELVGPLGGLVGALREHAPAGADWGEAAARSHRAKLADALDLATDGLAPLRVVDVARQVLPRETVASVDAGAHRLLVTQRWESYAPREFLSSSGLATMGYAIPGALAGRLAHPDRPVVAFCGDGGFLMAVAELQTAATENLPIVVVVFDDREIAQIRIKQEIKGLPRHGVDLGGVDYEKLAAGFGCDGVVVDTETALADALAAAIRCDRTTVIGARVDPSAYVEQFSALREI